MILKIVFIMGFVCFVYGAPPKQISINLDKQINDDIMNSLRRCIKEEENLYDFTKIIGEGTYNEEERFKHFIHCAFKESGYSNEDGTVKARKKADVFPDTELAYKIITECDKFRGDNPIDTTFNYFKCFQDNTPFIVSLV